MRDSYNWLDSVLLVMSVRIIPDYFVISWLLQFIANWQFKPKHKKYR